MQVEAKYYLIIKWMNGCEENFELSSKTTKNGKSVSFFAAKDFLDVTVTGKGEIRVPLQNVMYYYVKNTK